MMKVAAITRSIIGNVKRKFPLPSQQKMLSTVATSIKEDDKEGLNSIFFWGTPSKGTIPTKEALESGRGLIDKDKESLLNLDRFKSEVALDRPTEVDIQDAFGIGKQRNLINFFECLSIKL